MNVTISRLKKYAECASACYALFDEEEFAEVYIDMVKKKKNDNDSTGSSSLTEFEKLIMESDSSKLALDFRFRDFTKEITDLHIKQIKPKSNAQAVFLKQTENFLDRYKIKAHQPNTKTGFSATLFYDKVDDEHILAMRGTEQNIHIMKDYYADINLFFKEVVTQYDDMMKFYENNVKNIVAGKKIIVTGHSLGGALAQYFTISFHNDTTGKNQVVKETYTFNSPGIDVHALNIFGVYIQNPFYLPMAPALHADMALVMQNLINQVYSLISRDRNIKVYFNQMMRNNLKLKSISTYKYVYHIESCAGLCATKRWLKDNTTQHLGTDINGQYLYINNNMDNSMDSHGIAHTVSTLYFYDYFMRYNSNVNNFLMLNIKALLQKLNEYTIYADFLKKLSVEIVNIDNMKKYYVSYLKEIFIKAQSSIYNEPLYRIIRDISKKAGSKFNDNQDNVAIITNILTLEEDNVETIYVDDKVLNTANNLNDTQKKALYSLYPYIVLPDKIQHYHMLELIDNMHGKYLDILYNLYSSLLNTIYEVNQDVLYDNGECKQYSSIGDIIKYLYNYEKKADEDNDFIYICSI